jgi:hypothetical protein
MLWWSIIGMKWKKSSLAEWSRQSQFESGIGIHHTYNEIRKIRQLLVKRRVSFLINFSYSRH